MAKNSAPLSAADPADAEEASQETSPVTPPEAPEVTKSVSSSKVLPDAQAFGGPDMPTIQPHAVEAAKETLAASEAPASPSAEGAPVKGKTDFKGRPFNPALHEVNDDGSPAMNRDGYIKCFRGKPAAGASDTAAPPRARSKVDPTGGKAPQAAPPPDMSAQIDASAGAFTGLFLAAATLVGGEEFAPEAGEPEAIKGAFSQYFAAKGVVDVPPGVMLGGVLVVYVAKRWNAPKFAERRMSMWGNVRRWFSDFRVRRQLAREAADKVAKD